VELSRIAELVTEPQLGEIRLQWWRDALASAAAGETTGHPVADAVGRAVLERNLPRAPLDALVDARRFDVSVKIMPDMTALEEYLVGTAGALFQLSAAVLGRADNAPHAAARAAGLAYGLTGLMRALPVHTRRGRIDLPGDLLCTHGVSQPRVLAGERSEALTEVLAALRERAGKELAEASRQIAGLPPRSQLAFLPLALVAPYLACLEKADPFGDIVALNPLYRLWRFNIWRAGG